MIHPTDDRRILRQAELTAPEILLRELPGSTAIFDSIAAHRQTISNILHGKDDRLMVVVGPCSIHDPTAALEYAERLAEIQAELSQDLQLIMRVYFEKPRTTVGWKGLINDPDLDESFNINKGLRLARELLLAINRLGVAAGTEFLDVITPQYTADLVSWGAIGARTTESQVHRELASGLSCPVGFKNGTDGEIKIAADAVLAAQSPHAFLSVTKKGHSAIFTTTGNQDAHVILRGGAKPNYDAISVDAACREIEARELRPVVMVDCSHANSGKDPSRQPQVAASIGQQIESGETRIVGVMLESHLHGGRQDFLPGEPLRYGVSITDGCLSWEETLPVLRSLARSVRTRRLAPVAV